APAARHSSANALAPVGARDYGDGCAAMAPAPGLKRLRTTTSESRPVRTAGRSIMTIKITPNDKGNPPGKLAEAELHFADGPLDGLKLIGFSVWERKNGTGRDGTVPGGPC